MSDESLSTLILFLFGCLLLTGCASKDDRFRLYQHQRSAIVRATESSERFLEERSAALEQLDQWYNGK